MVIDVFAGGGGASLGIERALGVPVDLAINHDAEAMVMHWLNHPHTRHDNAEVWSIDPMKAIGGRPVGLAWFSPDCTHFSRAKGGKPVQQKIRSLAWIVVKWARAVHPRVIILENVPEFRDWGPLTKEDRPDPANRGRTWYLWCNQLRGLGYEVQNRELRACDYGAPTIRNRLFVIARCDGEPIVWPVPTHGPGRIAYRTAAECIDWSLPCPSIFLSPQEAAPWGVRRPLAEKTLNRIARGIRKFVLNTGNPFIIKFRQGATGQGIDEPMHTITAGSYVKRPAGAGHAMGLVAPTLIETGYGERQGQAPRAPGLDKPLGTAVGIGKHALVAAFLSKMYGTTVGADPREPMPTVTGQGNHVAEVRAFLLKYYGTGVGQACAEPLHTVTTKGRLGLVTVEGQDYQIADISLRMLTPRELARAQGFPDEYHLTGTKSNQVAKIGNSVCPPLAEALVRANVQLRDAAVTEAV